MEPYFSFCRGAETKLLPPGAAVREEELDDIGTPSDSESLPSSSSMHSSEELDDDATSSSSSSSGSDHHRTFEMASLLTQLPIKRGLSRFFDGKSQSFASLQAVAALEDLPKPPRKRLKPSRSCGGGLDAHRGRRLSPRRHCPKKTVARGGALAVLGAAMRRPPLAVSARPEGMANKVLVVS